MDAHLYLDYWTLPCRFSDHERKFLTAVHNRIQVFSTYRTYTDTRWLDEYDCNLLKVGISMHQISAISVDLRTLIGYKVCWMERFYFKILLSTLRSDWLFFAEKIFCSIKFRRRKYRFCLRNYFYLHLQKFLYRFGCVFSFEKSHIFFLKV